MYSRLTPTTSISRYPMNKTIPIPLSRVVENGTLIYTWLGALWSQLFSQQEAVKNYSQALGLSSAQLYMDFVETMALLDRNQAPVFHRDRWRALRLRRSTQNTGNAVAVKLGSRYTPTLGRQQELPFTPGAMLEIGGYAGIQGVTAYPLPAGISDVLTSITDAIVDPSVVLLRGVDFYVEDETLIFINGNDPFALGFPAAQVDGDSEVVLWATDVLVDKQLVYNYAGHVLGLRDVSSEFYARYVKGLWDLRNAGAPLALVQAGIAAILNEPFVIEAEEVVDVVLAGDTGTQVITDKHVYNVSSTAVLRTQIRPGATLRFGELLTQTVRTYDNLDPTRLSAESEYSARLRTDLDALFLPPGFFRASVKNGLAVSWVRSPITYSGEDANGNPKVKFQVYGSSEDVDAFWADFWGYCETHNIPSTSCFSAQLHATLPEAEGAVWGSLVPIEYFLYNYLKANLMITVVDGDKLSAAGRGAMHILGMLQPALPAHVCLLVMERRTIPTDEYDAGENVEDQLHPLLCRQLQEVAGVNEYSKLRLTYGDARPIVHLIPKCVGAADEI